MSSQKIVKPDVEVLAKQKNAKEKVPAKGAARFANRLQATTPAASESSKTEAVATTAPADPSAPPPPELKVLEDIAKQRALLFLANVTNNPQTKPDDY
ncbi:MAG: hypothetical protein ACKVPX_10040 [Myxococcaceae bacterium]